MPELTTGTLLIASPMLSDPNFMRGVVYLLEHNADGSIGLIINRPLDVPLGELWEDCPEALQTAAICAEGGPVERHKGLLLHDRLGLPGSEELFPGLAVGGDVAEIERFVDGVGGVDGLRLFLGHAGWQGGQLEEEVAGGSWLIRAGHPKLLLGAQPPEELWHELIDAGPSGPRPSAN